MTGGYTGSDFLDSTETFDRNLGSWVASGAKLPRPMYGLRAANINGRVLVFGKTMSYSSYTRHHRNIIIAGGKDDEPFNDDYDGILEYDPEEDSMVPVGRMTQARSYHAVSVVQVQDYAQWCQ